MHDIISIIHEFIPFYTQSFQPLFVFLQSSSHPKMANNYEITALLSKDWFPGLMKPYMISALVIAVLAFVFWQLCDNHRQCHAH